MPIGDILKRALLIAAVTKAHAAIRIAVFIRPRL